MTDSHPHPRGLTSSKLPKHANTQSSGDDKNAKIESTATATTRRSPSPPDSLSSAVSPLPSPSPSEGRENSRGSNHNHYQNHHQQQQQYIYQDDHEEADNGMILSPGTAMLLHKSHNPPPPNSSMQQQHFYQHARADSQASNGSFVLRNSPTHPYSNSGLHRLSPQQQHRPNPYAPNYGTGSAHLARFPSFDSSVGTSESLAQTSGGGGASLASGRSTTVTAASTTITGGGTSSAANSQQPHQPHHQQYPSGGSGGTLHQYPPQYHPQYQARTPVPPPPEQQQALSIHNLPYHERRRLYGKMKSGGTSGSGSSNTNNNRNHPSQQQQQLPPPRRHFFEDSPQRRHSRSGSNNASSMLGGRYPQAYSPSQHQHHVPYPPPSPTQQPYHHHVNMNMHHSSGSSGYPYHPGQQHHRQQASREFHTGSASNNNWLLTAPPAVPPPPPGRVNGNNNKTKKNKHQTQQQQSHRQQPSIPPPPPPPPPPYDQQDVSSSSYSSDEEEEYGRSRNHHDRRPPPPRSRNHLGADDESEDEGSSTGSSDYDDDDEFSSSSGSSSTVSGSQDQRGGFLWFGGGGNGNKNKSNSKKQNKGHKEPIQKPNEQMPLLRPPLPGGQARQIKTLVSTSSVESSRNASGNYRPGDSLRATIRHVNSKEVPKDKLNSSGKIGKDKDANCFQRFAKFLMWAQAFCANLPLTIGGLAYSCACMGVVWFKFAEENLDSCVPVHFHSQNCTYPEFPGCFECDTSARMYKVAYYLHITCSAVAGLLALSFFSKLILARRVVWDELSNPTTAAPAGLICMTLDIVFAGRGPIGEAMVVSAGTIHLCLAIWFMYMTLAYHIMPQPSWFPNTVGIGLSAVKTWLYYPMAGHFLMAISLSLNFLFFPISLIRVAVNRKIAATVGWMQMSAPNVSLYALTIMAQPSFLEEHPDVTTFQIVHRLVYLPCMHFLFGMCILGMCASIHSLVVRWKEFSRLPFSPAHVAFCAPTLSHANAVQAYRGAVDSFSTIPVGSPFKIALYSYWLVVLIGGTIVTLCFAFKFLSKLPEWTHIDTTDEIEPPEASQTEITSSNLLSTAETMVQPFVSPAILQAQEAGALVLSQDAMGSPVFRRTRKVTALGFEPIMSDLQMEVERELLLEWVALNPPRRRHRTVSVPHVAVYGTISGDDDDSQDGIFGLGMNSPFNRQGRGGAANRMRANTTSPFVSQNKKANQNQPIR